MKVIWIILVTVLMVSCAKELRSVNVYSDTENWKVDLNITPNGNGVLIKGTVFSKKMSNGYVQNLRFVPISGEVYRNDKGVKCSPGIIILSIDPGSVREIYINSRSKYEYFYIDGGIGVEIIARGELRKKKRQK